tara:strand:+ start:1461 stop:2810 length:1350 start_codon:yes stop_codon:yes gene_type:complete
MYHRANKILNFNLSEMTLINDQNCGWILNLDKRLKIKNLNDNLKCDFIIIGAGFTGLSAARKLGQIYKDKKIILIDAQLAGEGASSRNSGYLVDTTLNDGFISNKEISFFKKKINVYELGIKAVKKFIKEYQVDCDWNECGKYFASSIFKDKKKINEFSKILSSLNYRNDVLFEEELEDKLGTSFYKVGLYTYGGILLHPGKLIRAMIDVLPQNVILYENSPLMSWKKNNNKIECTFKNNIIESSKIIFCTNGFLSSQGIKSRYNFPLTLTASMTRALSNSEYESIGKPKEWGVLPIRPMGATVRMTKDRRILIRNTAELRNPNYMDKKDLDKRTKLHQIGLEKRFPNLPKNLIESSWSGVVCRSGNSSQIFEKIDDNIFVAGCYNGSGIGVGTLFGEQIALKAINQDSEEISSIEDMKKPNWLFPQPFLNIGIHSRLFYERIKASSEI